MFPIVEAHFLAPGIKRFTIEAPRIARKRKAGQFVIVRLHTHGERIPLTIADSEPEKGTITIIVQGIGKTTNLLNMHCAGDAILDVVGPLGRPSEVKHYGTVVMIGGGVGAAIAYPTAKAMKAAGNYVISIVGARNKALVILEPETETISDELHITTNDGSYGLKGFVTDLLHELIATGRQIDFAMAIGPVRMMQAVAQITRPYRIKTVVSLNTLMLDGTGMCGGCRVATMEGVRFACVDGPEFDAHQVDYELLDRRNRSYLQAESQALHRFLENPQHDLDLVHEACRAEQQHPEGRSREGQKT
jgi:ferredoxin--NADP+ reductase